MSAILGFEFVSTNWIRVVVLLMVKGIRNLRNITKPFILIDLCSSSLAWFIKKS